MTSVRDGLLMPSLRYPRRMVAGWLIFCLLAAGALVVQLVGPHTVIDNSVGVWFLADDPNLAEHENNNAAFGSREWSLLLLDTASVADPAFLRDPRAIDDRPRGRAARPARAFARECARPHASAPGRGPTLRPLLDPAAADPAAALRVGLARLPRWSASCCPRAGAPTPPCSCSPTTSSTISNRTALNWLMPSTGSASARSSVRSHAFAGTTGHQRRAQPLGPP